MSGLRDPPRPKAELLLVRSRLSSVSVIQLLWIDFIVNVQTFEVSNPAEVQFTSDVQLMNMNRVRN